MSKSLSLVCLSCIWPAATCPILEGLGNFGEEWVGRQSIWSMGPIDLYSARWGWGKKHRGDMVFLEAILPICNRINLCSTQTLLNGLKNLNLPQLYSVADRED